MGTPWGRANSNTCWRKKSCTSLVLQSNLGNSINDFRLTGSQVWVNRNSAYVSGDDVHRTNLRAVKEPVPTRSLPFWLNGAINHAHTVLSLSVCLPAGLHFVVMGVLLQPRHDAVNLLPAVRGKLFMARGRHFNFLTKIRERERF